MKASTPNIDLSYYKGLLKDQSAVEQAEKVLREFKAVDYDVKKWDDAVSTFESKAVSGVQFGQSRNVESLGGYIGRYEGISNA